jgi:hypothetical protein
MAGRVVGKRWMLLSLVPADLDGDASPSRPARTLGLGGASARDLVALGGAGPPVHVRLELGGSVEADSGLVGQPGDPLGT